MTVSLKGFLFTACAGLSLIASAQSSLLIKQQQTTICNPVNLSYRFCLDTPSRREAADPTMAVDAFNENAVTKGKDIIQLD